MLGRILVFSVVLSALAVAAPQVAPVLLSAVLHAADNPTTTGAMQTPHAASDSRSRDAVRHVALSADAEGHFVARATIDGRDVTVMVDTGATTVALSDATARRLGVNPPPSDYTERLSTANGVIMAARVNLDEVGVGVVVLRNVAAVVVPGNALPVDLLGMSFLGRLAKFEIAGGELVLSQ